MIPTPARARRLLAACCCAGLVALPVAVHAQSKDNTRAGGPSQESDRFETVTVNDQPTPPVELRATLQDGRTTCSPQTLRIPADGAIDLRIRNDSDQTLTVTSSELFAHGRQVRMDGKIAHAMSEIAYTIRPHSDGRVVVHTPKPGEYAYSCAVESTTGTPFKGTVNAVGGG